MRLILNGSSFETQLESGSDLGSLLQILNILPETVVIELNHNLYKSEDFDTLRLCDGDLLEIIHFVGGGA